MRPRVSDEKGWVWMTEIGSDGECRDAERERINPTSTPQNLSVQAGHVTNSPVMSRTRFGTSGVVNDNGFGSISQVNSSLRPLDNYTNEEPQRPSVQSRIRAQHQGENSKLVYGMFGDKDYTIVETSNPVMLPQTCIPRGASLVSATYVQDLLPDFFEDHAKNNPEEWAATCMQYGALAYEPDQPSVTPGRPNDGEGFTNKPPVGGKDNLQTQSPPKPRSDLAVEHQEHMDELQDEEIEDNENTES